MKDMTEDTLGVQVNAMSLPDPICFRCKRSPDDIPGTVQEAKLEELTPKDFIRLEDGTYNKVNGHFACDDCYYEIGTPSSPSGWKAP